MPSFKPKTNKKIKFNKKNSITLDGKHKEFLNDFSKDETVIIPELKLERNELTNSYNNSELTIEQKLDMKDRIDEITKIIKELKLKKKNYFLDNSKYIFDYFENKKNISTGIINSESDSKNKNKILNSFFKITNDESTNNLNQNKNNNIVQKYLTNIDDIFLDVNSFIFQTDICKICNKGELIPIEDEGILICNSCYRSIPYLIENEKPSYKEPPKEVCFYAYKRINHFKEILAQFQGKETTQIPSDVIENIKLQIKKERIELIEITNIKTKEILKKLGYNKYYEHIPFIKDKLGIKPPIMSPELEETLCNLFIELQSPYSKYCPDDRVNFLNYYYTAYKLCELLGEDQYLEHFPMLKDREKRIEQDAIWKKICQELDWEFIATI
uniref:Viral late gene transcription factor 3 zinc ribbon domain-containing protein n=1 Tax=viral metagenome TaxID=1070528 RepID=A0A6C0EQJ2_9ZZZZ